MVLFGQLQQFQATHGEGEQSARLDSLTAGMAARQGIGRSNVPSGLKRGRNAGT